MKRRQLLAGVGALGLGGCAYTIAGPQRAERPLVLRT